MSETMTHQPVEEFNALEQARQDAAAHERNNYYQWVGGAHELGQPTAAQDMVNYLEARPAQAGEATDTHYDSTLAESDYSNMGMTELARALGDAELQHDKTKEDDLMDALLQKIDDFTTHAAEARGPRTDIFTENPDGTVNDPALSWLDRMMAVKDQYKATKAAEMGVTEPGAEPSTETGAARRWANFEDDFERSEIRNMDDERLNQDLQLLLQEARSAREQGDTERERSLRASAMRYIDEFATRDNLTPEEEAEYRRGVDGYINEGGEARHPENTGDVPAGMEVELFAGDALVPLAADEQPTVGGRWARVRNAWNRTGARVATAMTGASSRFMNYMRNPEVGRTRKGLAAVGVGALALGGAVIAYKAVQNGSHGLKEMITDDQGRLDLKRGDGTGLWPFGGGSGRATELASNAGGQPEVSTEAAKFAVEQGHGFTQEIMDLAQAKGQNLTPERSYEIYQNLREQFGDRIIDGITTYKLPNGDLGINAPSMNAQWAPGVREAIEQMLNQSA